MAATRQQRIIKLDPNKIMKILHVDDKPSVLRTVRVVLEGKDYSVISAQSPEEAIEIIATGNDKIQLLIVDILFDQSANALSGVDFISKSAPRLKDITKMAYTAYRHKIPEEDRKLFDGGIFLKGDEEEEEQLFEKVDKLYNKEVEKIEKKIYESHAAASQAKYELTKEFIKQQQESLIKELESVASDEVLVASEEGVFTAKDLIREIKNNTEVGKRHVKGLLEYLDDKRGN